MRGASNAVLLAAVAGLAAGGCSWWHDEEADRGQPTAATPVQAGDDAFVRDVLAGGMAEVELGQLGSTKGTSFEVREFGKRMVSDHMSANAELRRLASGRGISEPAPATGEKRSKIDELNKLGGAEFDTRFMAMMVKDHEATIAKFEEESKNGRDSAVRDFANRTLPTLREHLRLAKDVSARLSEG